MAITLDANLEAQLESENRKPILELSSIPAQSSLPFVGQRLHSTSLYELWPDDMVHSNGEYVAIYSRKDASNRTNLYLKTSSNGQTWNDSVLITTPTDNVHWEYPSFCEMTTSTNLGIMVMERNQSSGAQKLRYFAVSMAAGSIGSIVTALTDAHPSQPSNMKYYEMCVRKMSDGTYLCISALDNNGTWELRRATHGAGSAWSSWATPAAMTFGGATVTGEKRRPFIGDVVRTGPVQEQWLFFDCVDASSGNTKNRNIYWGRATDKLAAVLAITKLTDITDLYRGDEDPSFVQLTINSFILSYIQRSVSVLLNKTSQPPVSYAPQENTSRYVHLDDGNQWLIVMDQGASGVGVHNGVHIIDLVNFSIVKRYYNLGGGNQSSPQLYNSAGIFAYWYTGGGKLVVAYQSTIGTVSAFDIIDIINDTVIPIYGSSVPLVSIPPGGYRITNVSNPGANAVCFNGTTLWWITASANATLYKIDLSSIGPDVQATNLGDMINFGVGGDLSVLGDSDQQATAWDLNANTLYVAMQELVGAGANREGAILKVDMNTGALLSVWRKTARGVWGGFPGFPATGARSLWLEGGKIYFAIHNDNTNYPSEPTGMGIIDAAYNTASGVVVFNSSPVGTNRTFDNLLAIKSMNNGKFILCTRDNGIGVYNSPTSGLATTFDDTNVPGFPRLSDGKMVPVVDGVYDATRNRIYLSCRPRERTAISGDPGAVFIFDLDGDIIQPMYVNVTALDSTPAFSIEQKLVANDEDDGLTLCRNRNNSGIAAFWSRRVSGTGEMDLYFDEEIPNFDILPYLSEDDSVTVTHSLEHDPNSLEFTVKSAELFDPTNSLSLYRSVLATGRRVRLRKGEATPAGNFLIDLFTGFVDSGSHSYQPKVHAERQIRCFDVTKYLGDTSVILTSSYGDGNFPSKPDGNDPITGILANMASTLGNIPLSDISFGTFDDGNDIEFQLANISPLDAMEVVANRFRRVIYVDNSGKITVKKIAPETPVSHVMNHNRFVAEFEPDENESENKNRVTVKGVSDSQIPVIYPEQIMKEYSGIAGWVQDSNDVIYVTYSDDFSIEAVNPRLKWVTWSHKAGPYPVLQPFTPVLVRIERFVRGADILSNPDLSDDSLRSEFMNRHGVRIKMGMYKFALKVLVSLATIATVILTVLSFIPGFSAISTSVILGLISTLSIAIQQLSKQWYYVVQIYAQPSGQIRQEISASANDTPHQQSVGGRIIEGSAIEFPLAFNVALCQFMADWFLFRLQLSRNIAQLTMMGHLKHEPGDIMTFRHPRSGQDLRAYIHAIRRQFKLDGTDTQRMTMGIF